MTEQDILESGQFEEDIDIDELEDSLEVELSEELSDLSFLQSEREKINDPTSLGDAIQEVVWNQFILQVGAVAGDDFIKENRGLKLDLRKDSHIQTTENFAEGKIATHNRSIDYQERYDTWQSKFQHNPDGSVVTHTTRTGKEEATLVKGARDIFDEGRPVGSVEKGTDMDHTVSAGEIIRDPEANAHLSVEDQVKFANSEANLNEMDASLNRSKGDKAMTDWLDTPNSRGQKPSEIFDIDEDLDRELREKDAEAREEYARVKQEGIEESELTGEESLYEEAGLMGRKAARAAVMVLFAKLIRTIIGNVIHWFKQVERTMKTLFDSIKKAISDFFLDFKNNLKTMARGIGASIGQAIIGPLFSVLRKGVMVIKKGWQSLKDAFRYLKDPANKNKPFTEKMLEVGKIVIAGLTAAGAIILGEVIEKALLAAGLHVQIPLLGSLANILGIFFGAVAAGILGAVALNKIDKAIATRQREENSVQQIAKQNDIIQTQSQLIQVAEIKLNKDKQTMYQSSVERHAEAHSFLRDSVNSILKNSKESENDRKKNDDTLDSVFSDLSGI